MLTKVVDALFTNFDRVNDDEVEVAASCGDWNVILFLNRAKVTESTMDTLQTTLSLCVLQLRSYLMTVHILKLSLTHVVDLLSNFTDRAF